MHLVNFEPFREIQIYPRRRTSGSNEIRNKNRGCVGILQNNRILTITITEDHIPTDIAKPARLTA